MATEGKDKAGLDALLARMPDIAKAVSAFPEGVQQSAFDALIAAAGGGGATGPGARTRVEAPPKPTPKRQTRRRKQNMDGVQLEKPRRARRAGGSPSQVRDLDLAPKGKTSLRDFAGEKQPKTNHDYNVLSVYYLSEELGIAEVTLNHVFTCYRDMRWKEPANLANSLALTANRKRYLDTANLDSITLMPTGRTHVEHDLPPKKKGK